MVDNALVAKNLSVVAKVLVALVTCYQSLSGATRTYFRLDVKFKTGLLKL